MATIFPHFWSVLLLTIYPQDEKDTEDTFVHPPTYRLDAWLVVP